MQVNDLRRRVLYNDAVGRTDMYFSAGAHIDKGARWSDEDYTHKSYMVVDLDIRMEMFTKENRVIDQDELLSIGNDILSSIPWKPKYVVDSGN